MIKILFSILLVAYLVGDIAAADLDELDLLDAGDEAVLKEMPAVPGQPDSGGDLNLSELEEIDDLNSLKSDIGATIVEKKEEDKDKKKVKQASGDQPKKEVVDQFDAKAKDEEQKKEEDKKLSELKLDENDSTVIFDVGEEEKKLIEISKFIEGKIPEKEWNEISGTARNERYVVQKGDWLWKISQKLFGSGFYYSKIWSLNPHITNPHEIEPGMALVFSTGDDETMPEVKLGEYVDVTDQSDENFFDFSYFGDNVEPPWLKERQRLKDQGVFFQYSSDLSYDDLYKLTGKLSKEYENYTPPESKYIVAVPKDQYDNTGFDRTSKLIFNYKEGFYLNSFVTTNPVIDYGKIDSMQDYNTLLNKLQIFYVHFEPQVKVKAGDLYSVYSAEGAVSHPVSDREGYRYTITGQLKTIRKRNQVWECELLETTGLVQRGSRITAYTPKINRIIKTFNKRRIEAAFIGSYGENTNGLSYGDVAYLDRGRADGMELGNVLTLYSFHDHGTNRRISADPTYKIGEATVITLTDNFSTALITNSAHAMPLGTLGITKSPEEAAETTRKTTKDRLKNLTLSQKGNLEELDVELNIDDVSGDLLQKADELKLTEDELHELERQEQEKSIIKDHERDLKELERLEQDIVDAENKLREAKVDEDKFLEDQNLDNVEGKDKPDESDKFDSLDDIEKTEGRKFMQEDLNSAENPYGLTEFDLEEIDELLNTDATKDKE
ncbi:MAG: hypothetical protein A2381_08210 [Bdellovibrionales bacterium RIFOXYB1_FULL_37_110]|nr:MAG: hypothetical protein A2181_04975 [Bdellovibrionales bacterium RIFOXYA1_FULL_38_20]OFZ52587.1 MAG: hypothetical protein A2417_00930 [Bdellovibrionales bacterium RIFOXYC1_FULL_37_79]OFZ59789.1 MAG: hypothetical protein A2381_08210 [Bdellovibrionales bacterium RIFOXYB1_FULL_37_110]OFZ65304.1 MAG: hypothetical protein A2577_04120 [Bdellovibrionales bacterium RIFOXYD1_FULL_36_51]